MSAEERERLIDLRPYVNEVNPYICPIYIYILYIDNDVYICNDNNSVSSYAALVTTQNVQFRFANLYISIDRFLYLYR